MAVPTHSAPRWVGALYPKHQIKTHINPQSQRGAPDHPSRASQCRTTSGGRPIILLLHYIASGSATHQQTTNARTHSERCVCCPPEWMRPRLLWLGSVDAPASLSSSTEGRPAHLLLWSPRTFATMEPPYICYYGSPLHFSATMGSTYISRLLWGPRTFFNKQKPSRQDDALLRPLVGSFPTNN